MEEKGNEKKNGYFLWGSLIITIGCIIFLFPLYNMIMRDLSLFSGNTTVILIVVAFLVCIVGNHIRMK